jgi:predicted dinucleotide-binding enzyme
MYEFGERLRQTLGEEALMKIAVIGAGNVGKALGLAWARRGHQVRFGVRNPAETQAQSLRSHVGDISVGTNTEAVQGSEVVVLCTPWSATQEAIASCGTLAGKVLIDCTNPVQPDISGLALGFDTSGAEQVALWAPGAQVFKAMNQIGSNRMDNPQFQAGTPVMFVCGDGDKKPVVMGLVQELGFDTVDAGRLVIARLLEPYAMLWIHLALVQGLGRDIGFALLRE